MHNSRQTIIYAFIHTYIHTKLSEYWYSMACLLWSGPRCWLLAGTAEPPPRSDRYLRMWSRGCFRTVRFKEEAIRWGQVRSGQVRSYYTTIAHAAMLVQHHYACSNAIPLLYAEWTLNYAFLNAAFTWISMSMYIYVRPSVCMYMMYVSMYAYVYVFDETIIQLSVRAMWGKVRLG